MAAAIVIRGTIRTNSESCFLKTPYIWKPFYLLQKCTSIEKWNTSNTSILSSKYGKQVALKTVVLCIHFTKQLKVCPSPARKNTINVRRLQHDFTQSYQSKASIYVAPRLVFSQTLFSRAFPSSIVTFLKPYSDMAKMLYMYASV